MLNIVLEYFMNLSFHLLNQNLIFDVEKGEEI